jgi:hypothetical protein
MATSFNNESVFISENSFKQNSQIATHLRKYVDTQINYNNISAIGGESYLYGLTNKQVTHINHYSNSESIISDASVNNKFYKKKLYNSLINYNTFDKIKHADLLIVNLAKLNINLLNQINKRYYKQIIIINCHHEEFWKRLRLLSNYKLSSRKQFITDSYFITVNVLNNRNKIPIFIPLGTTCTMSYQLNKVGLRKEAFPFDWAKMSVNQLNKVLTNGFESFSDIKVKKYSNNHPRLDNNGGSFIVSNLYNITFAHEVIDKNSIDEFKKILDKRIERLLSHKDDYIKFVRFNTGKKLDTSLLSSNLKKYFNNFDILEIHPDEQFTDWQYSHMNWFDLIV